MGIFVNRVLNMKKIKVLGFDMDHTIIRYHTRAFEELAFYKTLEKLVKIKKYPQKIMKNKFEFDLCIQGLVIDKMHGTVLKLSRYNKVKLCYFGTEPLPFKRQQELYESMSIDLRDSIYQSLDTYFATSFGIIFMQLVEMKKKGIKLPNYEQLSADIRDMIDLCHRDGSLKVEVAKDIKKYIMQDRSIVETLERFKEYGKRIWVITNSEFEYTKLLLDYAISPFLKKHKSWRELFEIVVTSSTKPRFFTDNLRFLKVDLATGTLQNVEGKLQPGLVYQGGCAKKLEQDFEINGREILYLGDHIYGDVVSLKKVLAWRTGLIIEPILNEVDSLRKTKKVQERIDALMEQKSELELKFNGLHAQKLEEGKVIARSRFDSLYRKIEDIDKKIGVEIQKYQKAFNPHWGELMRAGQEESLLADQIERYACIYMGSVGDLLNYSPRHYYRAVKRSLAHEFSITTGA